MVSERDAFLMLKPDAVHQGLTRRVDEWLRPRGFTPQAARLIDLTPELRSRLYATTRTGGALDWDLNAVLYTLGPALAVVLDGDPGEYSSASERLTSLKGDFRPSRAASGTMRADIGALNPIFNLVHTSDNPDELERELEAIGGVAWSHGSLTAYETQRRRPEAQLSPLTAISWCLARLDADGRPEAALPALAEDAPREQHQVGTVTAAMLAQIRELLDERRSTLPADTARFVAGVTTGSTSWPSWFAATSAADGAPSASEERGPWTDPWPQYLAYTTMRYLELCLGGTQ